MTAECDPPAEDLASANVTLDLHDLLVREAHLRLSRDQLKPVVAEKEAALRALEGTRPFFLPVMAKDKRAAYAEAHA